MIRWRYPLISLFAFVSLACAALGVDNEKLHPPRGARQHPRAQRKMKEKLRQAVSLPTISVLVGYRVNFRGEFQDMAGAAATSQIPEVEKELTGDATDAGRYRRLGHLYFRANQLEKSKEAYSRAVTLFRKQREQHPDDVAIQLGLADALVGAEKSGEAETLVRRVLADHPNDRHAWFALAEIMAVKCWMAILGPKHFHFSDPVNLVKLVRSAQPTPEKIAASQQYRREEEACYDRAVRLAPKEADVYRRRGASHFTYGMLEFGLRSYKGDKADFFDCFLGLGAERDFLPDLRRAVDLDRREYRGIGFVAFVEALREFRDYQIRNPSAKPAEKMLDVLSPPTREHIREDIARLDAGVQDSDKQKAAEAAQVLGFLQLMLFSDYSAAEKSARRSIELNPKSEAAWDLLDASLRAAKDERKWAVFCRERMAQKDCASNRVMLAKLYELQDRLDKAEEVVRIGLRREPNDFMLRLALADLRLLHGDEASLYLAGESLVKLYEADLLSHGREDRWANCTFACGIYFGLIGKTERATEWLKLVQKHKPDYPKIEDALKALED